MNQTNVVLLDEEAKKRRPLTNVVLLQEERRSIKVHISDLILLTDIPGAEIAVRPINEAHVQSLVKSDISTWPAIKLAPANVGLLLFDGYQRLEAAIRKGESILDAVIHSYATMTDVIDAAFRADFTHGWKASEQRLGDYAFWLHRTFEKMSQEEIALRAAMSQPGVSKAIAKRLEEIREAELLAQGIEKPIDVERVCKQFSRRVVRFVGEVETFSDEDLLKNIQASVKEKDQGKLARMGRLLVQAYGGQ